MPSPFYTSVDRVLEQEPMLGSVTTLTSAHMFTFVQDAEAEVDATIALRYAVPVTGEPPILRTVATDLAIYRILRRFYTQERLKDSVWPQAFKEARDTLKMLAEGSKLLVDTSGTLIAARSDVDEVWSSTEAYHPTFHEGPRGSHIVDEDKLEDIADERDLGSFGDLVR